MSLLARSLAAGVAAVSLAACGGGESEVVDIDFTAFALSTDTLVTPVAGAVTMTVQWSVAVNGGAGGGYMVQVYAELPEAATGTPSEAHRFLQRNCTAPLGCGNPHKEVCSFTATRRLSCSTGLSVALAPGPYVAVARVCTYDKSLAEICDTRRQNFEVR